MLEGKVTGSLKDLKDPTKATKNMKEIQDFIFEKLISNEITYSEEDSFLSKR